MTLYSYCIPVDDGAAPNPFGGVCTLTICKPVIRRTAQIGDWIIATGSKNSPIGNISKKVVYIMKVTKKLTLEKYDEYCQEILQKKIPNIRSSDYRRQVGDCIYDYGNNVIKLRPGVHGKSNVAVDLGGCYSLLSDNFYYFGDNPIDLPEELYPIIKSGQGHRSKSNQEYIGKFLQWVNNLKSKRNKLMGKPQIKINFKKYEDNDCADIRCKSGKKDEIECVKGIC